MKKIALVVSNTTNPWFKVMSMDTAGNRTVLHDGPDLGRVLTHAANILGYPLVIPISGPDTVL